MTITLSWWMLPVALLITGYFVANWFYKKHFSPGGYIPDFVTAFVAAMILLGFVLVAIAGSIGYWLGS